MLEVVAIKLIAAVVVAGTLAYAAREFWDNPLVDPALASFIAMALVLQFAANASSTLESTKKKEKDKEPKTKMTTPECHHCNHPSPKLRCSRCRVVWYCDARCQQEDWTRGGHNKRCRSFEAVSKQRDELAQLGKGLLAQVNDKVKVTGQ